MKTGKLARRTLLAGAAVAPLVPARAQTTLPDRQVQLLVGFVTSGGTDIIARKIAVPIERRIGRHITVINRPGGAGGAPGEALRKDAGEGNILAFMPSTTLVSSLLSPGLPFDPLTDVAPITIAGTWPIGLAVSPSTGIKTFEDYVKWLKSEDPKRRKLGSTASDAFVQIFSAMVGKEVGTTLEAASYRGSNPMVSDLRDGKLSAAVSGLVSLMEHHRGGRLRLLMITAPKRLANLPDVPTARELGFPALEDLEWFAFFTSAKTSPTLINEWNRQIVATMADQGLAVELSEFGMTTETCSPEEAKARVAGHISFWKSNMLNAGMKPT